MKCVIGLGGSDRQVVCSKHDIVPVIIVERKGNIQYISLAACIACKRGMDARFVVKTCVKVSFTSLHEMLSKHLEHIQIKEDVVVYGEPTVIEQMRAWDKDVEVYGVHGFSFGRGCKHLASNVTYVSEDAGINVLATDSQVAEKFRKFTELLKTILSSVELRDYVKVLGLPAEKIPRELIEKVQLSYSEEEGRGYISSVHVDKFPSVEASGKAVIEEEYMLRSTDAQYYVHVKRPVIVEAPSGRIVATRNAKIDGNKLIVEDQPAYILVVRGKDVILYKLEWCYLVTEEEIPVERLEEIAKALGIKKLVGVEAKRGLVEWTLKSLVVAKLQ